MKIVLRMLILFPCYMMLNGLGILKNKIEEEIERSDLAIDKGLLYLVIAISYIPGLIALLFEKWE